MGGTSGGAIFSIKNHKSKITVQKSIEIGVSGRRSVRVFGDSEGMEDEDL